MCSADRIFNIRRAKERVGKGLFIGGVRFYGSGEPKKPIIPFIVVASSTADFSDTILNDKPMLERLFKNEKKVF